MRVRILCFANQETGWGHWYRSLALAEYLQSQGHQVILIGDRRPPVSVGYHSIPYNDQALWHSPLVNHCDWLVIDLPDDAPAWLYKACKERGVKTLVLNGVGHKVGNRATLRIIQGLTDDPLAGNEYAGVEYIILRDSVFRAKAMRQPIIEWFVFGGAADKINLTRFFPDFQRISFSISVKDWQDQDRHDEGFLMAASQCQKACVAMGMTAWELAAMRIPTYVFSLTELHLKFALGMQAAGYIKAWPNVGLPMRGKMIDFLQEPYQVTGKPIDGRACGRILELMKGV